MPRDLVTSLDLANKQTELITASQRRAENMLTAADMNLFKPTPTVSFESRYGRGLEQPSWTERYLSAPFGRGIDRFQAYASLAFNDLDEFTEQQREIAAGVQLTPEDQKIMQRISETDSYWEATKLYAMNGRLAAAMTMESLGLFAPTLAAAGAAAVATPIAAGLTGAAATSAAVAASAAATAAGSFGTEYLATIEGEMARVGVDLENVDQINKTLSNDAFMSKAREKAVLRGIPIAAFDALSIGLAGRIARGAVTGAKAARAAGKAARPLSRYVAAGAGETALQAGLGGAGEAGGQLLSEGRITSPGEIVSEAVGEIGPGAVEIGIGMTARRNRTVADAPTDTTNVPKPNAAANAPASEDLQAALAGLAEDNATEKVEANYPVPGAAAGVQAPVTRRVTGEENFGYPVPTPVIEEPTPAAPALAAVPESTPAPVIEEAPAPIPAIEEQPVPVGVTGWMTANRNKNNKEEVYRLGEQVPGEKDTRSRKAANTILKEKMVALGNAIRNSGISNKEVRGGPPSMKHNTAWPAYWAEIEAALQDTKDPTLAAAVQDELANVFAAAEDPSYAFGRLENLLYVVENEENAALMGTPFESVKSQYERTMQKLRPIFEGPKTRGGKPLKGGDNQSASSDLSSLRRVVATMLTQRWMTFLPNKNVIAEWMETYNSKHNADASLEPVSEQDFLLSKLLTEKLEDLPKYLTDKVIEVDDRMLSPVEVIDETRRMFDAGDKAPFRRLNNIYKQLSELGDSIAAHPNAAEQERADKLANAPQQSELNAARRSNEKKRARTNLKPPPFTRPAVVDEGAPISAEEQEFIDEGLFTQESETPEGFEVVEDAKEPTVAQTANKLLVQAGKAPEKVAAKYGIISDVVVTGAKAQVLKEKVKTEAENKTKARKAAKTKPSKPKEYTAAEYAAVKAEEEAAAAKAAEETVEAHKETPARTPKREIKPRWAKTAAKTLERLNVPKQLRGSGIVSGIPFFANIFDNAKNRKLFTESDAGYVLGFIEDFTAKEQAKFETLLADYLAQPTTNPVAAQQLYENIDRFVKGIVGDNPRVISAVRGYAQALRTVSNRGMDSSTIVLEQSADNLVNAFHASIGEALNEKGTNLLLEVAGIAKKGFDNNMAQQRVNYTDEGKWGTAGWEQDVGDLRPLLIQVRNSLKPKHILRPLMTAFINTGINPTIRIGNYGIKNAATYEPETNTVKLNAGQFTNITYSIYDSKVEAGRMLGTLLHEAVHAATVAVLASNPKIRALVENMRLNVIKHLEQQGVALGDDPVNNPYGLYGLKNEFEFLAEAFSNAEFQAVLQSVPGFRDASFPLPRLQKIWDMLVDVVRRILHTSKRSYSMLDSVMRAQPLVFGDNADVQAYMINPTPLFGENSSAANTLNLEINPAQLKEGFNNLRKNVSLVNRASEIGTTARYGFSGLDVIERRTRRMFDEAYVYANLHQNPVTRIFNAVSRVAARALKLGDTFTKLAEKTREVTEQERLKLYEAMTATTFSQYDPVADTTSLQANLAAQPWLFNKDGTLINQTAVDEALSAYNALAPETKQLYQEYRDIMESSYNTRRSALVRHGLQKHTQNLTEQQLDELSGKTTMEDFNIYTAAKQIEIEDASLFEEIYKNSKIQGPYFPLKRDGKWIVYIESDEESERWFSMHDTQEQAQATKAELGDDSGAIVARKNDKDYRTVLRVHDAANAIASKLEMKRRKTADPAEQKAIESMNRQMHDAVTELLADRSLYSAQLKRKGVRGFSAKDMPRNIEGYVRSTVTAASTIESSFDYEQGINELLLIDQGADPRITPEMDYQATLIRNELLLRAKMSATDRAAPLLAERIIGSVGFFTFLGAPSYWILNATQTAVVGIPVLAGIASTALKKSVGLGQATGAMASAHKQLKAATQGKGWKALDDLESVYATLPSEQAEIVKRLVLDNIVQATIAHEFGLMVDSKIPVYNKVTGFLQKVPEMIERWNRISMAIAAMELGVTDYTAVRDIVQASQFNYSTENRGRLLKNLPEVMGGAGKQIVSPIMMFKVFAFNMAEILYGNMVDALGLSAESKIDPTRKAEARKVLGGVLATHTAFGGLVGGLGLGIGDVIVNLVNAMLDDEDELDPERILDDFLTEHTNDYVSRLVMRGLPAAVGVDMSASINLGSLFFMSRDQDWGEYGGFEQSVYGALGPVAQYASGGIREIARFASGESDTIDLAQKLVPLKLAKSLITAGKYATEGLETRQGQNFYDNVDVGDLVITALGLRSAPVAQTQNRFYADRGYNRTLESRKSELMGKAAQAEGSEYIQMRKDVTEWNKKMRERRNYSLIIKPSSIKKSRQATEETQRRYDRGPPFTDYHRP